MPTYSRRDSERLGRPPRIKKQSCSGAMLSSVQAIVERHSFRPISELRGSTPCVYPRLGIQCCHIEPRGSAMQMASSPRPSTLSSLFTAKSGLEARDMTDEMIGCGARMCTCDRASRLCDPIASSPRDHQHIMHKCKPTHTSASCPEPRGSAILSHPRLGSHHLCTSVLHTHQCIAVNP